MDGTTLGSEKAVSMVLLWCAASGSMIHQTRQDKKRLRLSASIQCEAKYHTGMPREHGPQLMLTYSSSRTCTPVWLRK